MQLVTIDYTQFKNWLQSKNPKDGFSRNTYPWSCSCPIATFMREMEIYNPYDGICSQYMKEQWQRDFINMVDETFMADLTNLKCLQILKEVYHEDISA